MSETVELQRCKWCARPVYFHFGKWYHWKGPYWCYDNNGTRRAPSPYSNVNLEKDK